MRKPVAPASHKSPRFIHQPDTIDTLAMAKDRLESLNEDYHALGFQDNPRSTTHPYEGAILYSIDQQPSDRATALLHSPSYGLGNDTRLNFFTSSVKDRRIILSQSALQLSLVDGERNRPQLFHDSRMNPGSQMVWAQPLIYNDKSVAAVQLAFTLNKNPDWQFPSNRDVDTIWEKHKRPMQEVAKALAALATQSPSLSKSLEKMPPVTPNAFVIQWDVINSGLDAIHGSYAVQEAYLDTWKVARNEITKKLCTAVLSRVAGESVILPIHPTDLHNRAALRLYAKQEILPLVNELISAHNTISSAYRPELFKQIKVAVGVGHIEEDHHGQPSGQVLHQLKSLADASTKPLVFSPEAEEILF